VENKKNKKHLQITLNFLNIPENLEAFLFIVLRFLVYGSTEKLEKNMLNNFSQKAT
jgi:hypothetical protein